MVLIGAHKSQGLLPIGRHRKQIFYWLYRRQNSFLLVHTENKPLPLVRLLERRFPIGCLEDITPSYWGSQKTNPSHWLGNLKDDFLLAVSTELEMTE